MPDSTVLSFVFPSVRGRNLAAAFDGVRLISDGSLLPLAQAAGRLGIAEKLAAVIPDRHDPSRILHSLSEIARALIMATACGYDDADDLNYLCADRAFELVCARLTRELART